jgi:uncharacterized protein YggE
MKRTWWLVPFLVVLLTLGVAGCTHVVTSPLPQQNTGIWVTGQGEVTAIPDIAELLLGIEAQANTVSEAQAQASEVMDRVMEALKDNGVAEKDIQTQQFSIYPVTSVPPELFDVTASDYAKERIEHWYEEEIVGYRVTNIVLAKIRDVDKAGIIIDAVANAGGDLTCVEGISFSIDDPTLYYAEAQSKAMEDAVNKAARLATSAGIQLGKPTYISEGAVYVPRYFDEVATGEAFVPETPISPGELKITVNVQVVYEIK